MVSLVAGVTKNDCSIVLIKKPNFLICLRKSLAFLIIMSKSVQYDLIIITCYNFKEIMPHLVSNLVEKAYTPYTARLAPRQLWSRPALGKFKSHPAELPSQGATNVSKLSIRWHACM